MEKYKSIQTSEIRRFCTEFLEFKRFTGVKYNSEEKQLRQFSDYCEQNYTRQNLPEDVLSQWLLSDTNQSLKTRNNKASLIKTLAQYLFSLGYMPLRIPMIRYTSNTIFTPHIFTADEMEKIWKTVDNIKPAATVPNLHRCIPVLFRLLWASGLRISEALGIDVKDVDFTTNVITILRGKLDKERIIPMSDSLSSMLKKYTDECTAGFRQDEPLFYYRRGERLEGHQIYQHFRLTLLRSGIPYKGKDKGPRLHDFRHTFAVNAMNKMADDRKDLYVALPILSAYLGHESVESTERYVRLTEERIGSITERFAIVTVNAFPEVAANGEI